MLREKVEKKIHPNFFQQIIDGDKKFEYRNEEHLYDVGTIIVLREFNPVSGYTGRSAIVSVTSKTSHSDFEAVPPGWCILSIKLLAHRVVITPPSIKEVLC